MSNTRCSIEAYQLLVLSRLFCRQRRVVRHRVTLERRRVGKNSTDVLHPTSLVELAETVLDVDIIKLFYTLLTNRQTNLDRLSLAST